MGATLAPKTMVALLLLGVINFLVPAASGTGDPVTVLSILKASKEAIESYDVQRNMEIVHKHYFTTTKEENVFHHAIIETQKEFKVFSTLDELRFIEKLIQKLKNHLESCLELPNGLNKAQCFYELFELLKDLESGIRWEIVPKDELRLDKTRLGTIYQSAAVLNAHLSIIATKGFQYYDNNKVAENRVKPFTHLMEKTSFNLKSYMKSMNQWLTDSISPVRICWLSEVLWQSFEKDCETRWVGTTEARVEVNITKNNRGEKRQDVSDISNENAAKRENSSSFSPPTVPDDSRRRQQVVVVPERPERLKEEAHHLKSFESDYLNMEERSVTKIMDLFGGSKGKRNIRFRVQVTDLIDDDIFFQKTLTTTASSRGGVLDELARQGLEARSRHFGMYFNHKLDRVEELTEITRSVLATTAAHINSVYRR